MSLTHKLGLWGSLGKLEIVNERLIFTPPAKGVEAFTIKLDDLDVIDLQKTSWVNYSLRLVTKWDKIYNIPKLDKKNGEMALSRIENHSKAKIDTKDEQTQATTKNVLSQPKKEPTEEDKIGLHNFGLWFAVIVIFLIWSVLDNLMMILLFVPILGVWATKTMKTKDLSMIQRLKSLKSYKARYIISIILLLFCGAMVQGKIATLNENPPEIEAVGGENIDLGTWADYQLSLNIKDTKSLTINGQKITVSGDKITKEYNLSNTTWLTVHIVGKNTVKTTEKTITVIRSLSESELAKIKADEDARLKVEAEAKAQAEEARKKEEVYKNSPEYKAVQQQLKLDQALKDHSSDMKYMCTEWVKLMLKAPSTADFPSISKFRYGVVKKQLLVQSYVDSQNGFGAQIRTKFICYFDLREDDIVIVDIKFDN